MINGTIKKFFADRGFDLIERDDRAPDVLVHIRDLQKSGLGELVEGDRVSFELEPDHRTGRLRAADVRLVEGRGVA